ncbi:hypothetical protein CYLTODRAFT_492847 [Cylindrobasidium torrendii FP15055 ss-10]|uniref:Uncharacterized protein n=1 Tax=Cylindrobasidium torrendii FP15055 ss-10 TaxID=1314674 RepID=A0A0D7B5I9_9AGAR|nr:hypothetical protein CYLTODRAFT_492847 [Cylindrobasidium torrendii FP15055 ss-10]
MLIDKLSFHTLVDGVHDSYEDVPLHHRVARAIEIIECLEKKYGLGPDFDAMLDIVDSTHPLGCLAGKPGYTTTEFEKEKRVHYQRRRGDQATRMKNFYEMSLLGYRDFITWNRTCYGEGNTAQDSGICGYLLNLQTPTEHLLTVDRLGGQSPGTFDVKHRMNSANMSLVTHKLWVRGVYLLIPVVSAQKLRMPRRFVETVKHNKECAPKDRINIRNDFPLRSKESSPGYLYLAVDLYAYRKPRDWLYLINGEMFWEGTVTGDGCLTLFHGDPLVCTYASAINKDNSVRAGIWDVGLAALTPTVRRLVEEFVEVTEGWTSGALAESPDEYKAAIAEASEDSKPLQARKRHGGGFFSEKAQ